MTLATKETTKRRFSLIFEVLFQQILAVFILLILWELLKSNYYEVTDYETWHIILCVVGLALCMAEGVQMYRKESIVSFGSTRTDKKKSHLIVMLFGFICITAGISLQISHKLEYEIYHFQSLHSKLGLSAWILSFIAIIGGAVTYAAKLKINPVTIKIFHTIVGLSAYIVGVLAIIFGLDNLFCIRSRDWVILIVLLLTYVSYSLIGPCTSLYKYIIRKQ